MKSIDALRPFAPTLSLVLVLSLALPLFAQAREISYEDRAVAESVLRDHLTFFERLEKLDDAAAEHKVRRFWFDHWRLAEMVRDELETLRDRAGSRNVRKVVDRVFGRDAHEVIDAATKDLGGLKKHHKDEFVAELRLRLARGRRLLSQFEASEDGRESVVGQIGFEGAEVTAADVETVGKLLEEHRYLFERLSLLDGAYSTTEDLATAEDPWAMRAELDRLRTSLREKLDTDELRDVVKNVLGPKAVERLLESTKDIKPTGRSDEEDLQFGLELVDQLARLCPVEKPLSRIAEAGTSSGASDASAASAADETEGNDEDEEPGFGGISSW